MPSGTTTSHVTPEGSVAPPAPTTESLFADLKKAAEKGRRDRGTPAPK